MRLKKLSVALMSALMAVGMMAMPAKAASYTPIAGTSCNFNKYLIMDSGDSVPNATFSFTVAPGQAVSASTSGNAVMEVMAGIGTPTIADVTFAPGDETATSAGSNIDVARNQEARTGTAGTDTVQLDEGEKYATKQATVSFSGITFPEPGIYRYVISETANADHAAAGIIHDTDTDRILDVYVVDNNGSLEVASYVLHTNASNPVINTTMGSADVAAAGNALSDKTDGFTNEYSSKDLKIEKEVTGNQASKDKYFEFTVKATNVADTDTYVVSLANDNNADTNDGSADATSGEAKTGGTIAANAGKTNPTTVTGAQLKSEAGVKFYLQHGQSIVIRGLAPNAGYTVTENAEDYASAPKNGDTNSGTIGTVAGSNKMATAGFTNTRDGIIPTGVVSAVAGGIALLGVGAGGYTLLSARKKDRDEDE